MYSWNLILPLLVSTSNLGNSSPRFTILCQKVDLLATCSSARQGATKCLISQGRSTTFFGLRRSDWPKGITLACISRFAGEKTGNENVISMHAAPAVTELYVLA